MRTQSADMNATLEVAYFILAVRAAGLAAGPMTGYDAAALNEAFFADSEHKVLAVVNISKPGEGAWSERLPRLGFDEVVSTV
jgi:3-hydroxypropanoate dehydrogenase